MSGGSRARRLAAVVAAGLVWGTALANAARAQDANDAAALSAEVGKLARAGKYAEATEIAKRLLALREKALGPEHPDVGTSLNSLAGLYREQGRYTEAEPLLRRGLAIRERALGPEHPDVATVLNSLAALHRAQGLYAEAEPLLRRSLAIREKALGPEHRAVGVALNYLGELYRDQGRYAEAEPLLRRSVTIHEKVSGPEDAWVGTALDSLAQLYREQGRYAEAEPLYRRSLAVREKVLGPEHQHVGTALNNLAGLYRDQGRTAEAEPLLRRSLAIWEMALGPEHPDVGTSLVSLAGLYLGQGRIAEAEPLLRRGLSIYEKALGPEHSWVATALNHLAALYRRQGRTAEAEPLLRRSLAIQEKALGPEHPTVGAALDNLAALHRVQGLAAEAELLLRRSLAIYQKTLGPEHPVVGTALSSLAGLAFSRSDWAGAAEYWRRSTSVIKVRSARGLARSQGEGLGGEAQRLRSDFWGLAKTTYRLVAANSAAAHAAEMFETAQWAQGSEAAGSLAQMAARSAKGLPEISLLVRERQDLVREWQAKDKQLIAAKSEPPAKRKADTENALADRLAAIDTRLAAIDARLAKDFPDYAALASPAPLSAAEVQGQLRADEALVLFLDTPQSRPLPEETFIWVVTKSDVRWVRSDIGTAALGREVAALRCGLDSTAWGGEGARRCADLLKLPPGQAPKEGEVLPFDVSRAHALYKGLFGEVQDLIKGKHLLIVPSGPLTQLPFQVLVTRPPVSGDHRAAAWLAREHAITILPAVSSLKALRRVGRPSAAPRPMIGIGNPLLDGSDARYASLAKQAQAKQRCPDQRPQRLAARKDHRAGPARVETRGGLADVSDIKRQVPLPETADELCAVAQDVKAEAGRDILLGAKATEREVKRLSAAGELAKYRMVHFATHGLLAGDLKGTHEPGLILTPPGAATEEDDGYLSASEIAALKLDADWVILSACNTAAGAAASAEALSGLARAFIYAQARALLVSHWEVYSDATVKLVTGAIREMARDPKVGRAEALRRSMLALIDKGAPHEARPAYWAPFVVVGEGGQGR